jgi:hypothetical protein
VVATSAIVGLTATGPALAADEPPAVAPPVALPEMPEMPEIEPPAIPVPEAPSPELFEPPVVVTQVDAENIDVSIRVLSPGEDAEVAQESETTVVSPTPDADITELTEKVEAEPTTGAEPTGAVNTNVSVRVLSPGNRGDVAENGAGGGEADVEEGAGSPIPLTGAAPASTPQAGGQQDAAQYHDVNSQYQSGRDSWNWRWTLSLDCAGNATSSSTETGKPESLDWSWEWIWDWCSEGSQGSPTGTTSSPPPAAPPPERDASSPDPLRQPAEPWAWTWTFTLCGETHTITTASGAGTPLTWTWDWSWTWSCGAPAETGASSAVPPTAPPLTSEDDEEDGDRDDLSRSLQQMDEPADETFPATWFPSFTTTGGRNTATTFVWPTFSEQHPLEISVEVAIPPVVLPAPTAPSLTSPAEPSPAVDVSAEPTSVAPQTRPIAQPLPSAAQPQGSTWDPRSRATTHTAQPPPRAHHARPAKHTGAKSRRGDRSSTPFRPFDGRQPHQTAGSSNGAGFVPSALLFGVAALTGFILLAAPGLGRRIRVARELSPRGLEHSPLDRPG